MLRSFTASLSLLVVVSAQSPVQSTFTGGLVISNPGPAAATMYFDVTVVDPAGITVTQFDCNLNTTSGTNGTLGVWVTGLGGTHVGAQTTAALWTQVGTATRTHSGGRTSFLLQTPFSIYGFQPYFTTGAGYYQEALQAREDSGFGFNTGGGVKVTLVGPLRVRVDYRVFRLTDDALYPTAHRLYAGLNLKF